jgi:hypothetical protein
VKAVILALLFVLPLGGCAGGQPRSLTTTANQAEDAERLTSMMQNCYNIRFLRGQDLREVRPFVEMTSEQAAAVAVNLLQRRILPIRVYGGSTATRLTQRQAEEVADCLRDTYDLPITVTKTITSASK